MSIPIVDIDQFTNGSTAERTRIAATLDQALRRNGFFLVEGHGIQSALLDDMRRVSREFFAATLEEKLKVAQPRPGVMRGYVAMGRESLSHSRDREAPPDLNESFMIGQPDLQRTDRLFAANLWPDRPAAMKAIWTDYYGRMEALANRLMRMLAASLHLPDDAFDDMFATHTSRLRVRYYPGSLEPPRPGQLRAGSHTDYGSLAIVAAEDRPGGLQVREPSGQWIDVPVIDGCLIVNIGDLMARWTNARWPAALHRVANPPQPMSDEAERLSLVYFQSPGDDVLIECLDACRAEGEAPKYLPVRAGDYLSGKFRKVDQGGASATA